jgi:hypothetical protein
MLDKVEKVFPEALPAVQRQSIAVRLLILIAILTLPLFGLVAWSPLRSLLFQGATIQVPIRLLAVIILTALIVGVAISLALARLRRRARLRVFVRQWSDMREHLMLLHANIEAWALRTERGFDDPDFTEITRHINGYASRRIPLRRLLFILGEKTLVANENQRWRELKSKEPIFKERDYLTPFGFLLDLDAPIYSVNHHGRAIWAALFISDDFVEHLRYKYPFLEKADA